MTKNFLLFVFKTKLENLTKHYPTHLECLFLFTIMSGRSCFLEFYSAAKGSEHQKSDKEEESASFLVVPSCQNQYLRRHHTVVFGLMNHEPRNSNVYCGFHGQWKPQWTIEFRGCCLYGTFRFALHFFTIQTVLRERCVKKCDLVRANIQELVITISVKFIPFFPLL